MFAAWCDGHGARVLLGPDNMTAVVNGPRGVEVRWQCGCGHRGAIVHVRA